MGNRYLLRRFFAYQIDLMIIFIMLNIILYVYNIYIHNISIENMSFVMLILTSNLLAFFYFVFSDFFFRKTFGKKLMRLQIKGFEQNNKAKLLKQIIIRNLFRLVPFDQVSILFYDDYRMWHDKVSRTTVSSLDPSVYCSE